MAIFSMHAMIAKWTDEADLALKPQEAHALAANIANVAQYYPVLAEIDPKVMAWGSLMWTVGLVYGPRAALVAKKRRGKKPAARPASVAPQPGMAAPIGPGWPQHGAQGVSH